MNQMYVKLTLSLLRQLLKAGGLTGIAVSDQEWIQMLSAVATLWGFGWGFWKDYKEQKKLNTALSMPRVSTERDVENLIAHHGGASVMSSKTEVPSA